MSIRTLLEINHDCLHKLQQRPAILAEIIFELGMSIHNAALNEANNRGRSLDLGHGVRLVMQRHHQTDVTVKSEYVEVRL